jgi:exopolysaccharide production protein ExoZ
VNTRTKIDSMQAMRGFAATCVMIFHGTKMLHRELHYTYVHNIFLAGFMGVDVFFVLSGFIIFYTSKPESFQTANFLKKRFVRIYPIYWLITIGLIVMYLLSPSPGQAYKRDPEVIAASFTLFPQAQYVLGVAWTLAYEIIFYLVFAITCSISVKWFYRTFVAWAAIILITYFFHIESRYFAVNALVNPIILNFSFGCLLAYLYKNHRTFAYWRSAVAFGAILVVTAWTVYYLAISHDPTAFTSLMSRVYLFGIPSAILIGGLLYFTKPVPRLLVNVGDASYSLYLIHGTVLSFLLKMVSKVHLSGHFNNFFGTTLLFALTIGVSLVFYNYIEKPMLAYLNKVTRSGKANSQTQPAELSPIL